MNSPIESEEPAEPRMGSILAVLLAVFVSFGAAARLLPVAHAQTQPAAHAQTQPALDATAKANQQQAQTLLDEMVDALGDLSWRELHDSEQEGRISYFEHGNPTGEITPYWFYHLAPDHDRYVFGKKRDVVQIFTGDAGYEFTYRGRAPLPKDIVEDYLRRRSHSVEVVVRTWLGQPGTVLIYEGQTQVERHLADKVTIFSPTNDSVTLEMDAESHLPLRRTFQWRNPIYKDKDEDSEEYDDYHLIQGFPTPYTTTRYRNGDMVSQRFLYKGSYNTGLPASMFDPDSSGKKK